MDLVQDLPQREQPGQSKVAQATHLIYTLSQTAEQVQRRRLHREPAADPALAQVGRHLDAVEQALGRATERQALAAAQRETSLAGGHLEDAANVTASGALGSAMASTLRTSGTATSAAVVNLGEARAALARARQALTDAGTLTPGRTPRHGSPQGVAAPPGGLSARAR